MATKPPSTAPEDPLRESLTRITGGPLSTDTGTSPVAVSPLSYANATPGSIRPGGDVINLSQAPGLNYTPAEQWAHELGLAQLAQKKEESDREFELTKKAANFESMVKAMEFADYMRDRNRGRGATLRVAGGGGYGGFQPSSGKRPAPTWVGSNPRGSQSTNQMVNLRYKNRGGGVPVVQTELSGPALGTYYNQMAQKAMRENREMPVVIQKKRPWI